MIVITCMTTFEIDSDDLTEAAWMLRSKVNAGLVECPDPRDGHPSPVRVSSVQLGTHAPMIDPGDPIRTIQGQEYENYIAR